MVYKSAVDWWYYLFLAFTAIVLAVLLIPLLQAQSIIGIIILLVFAGLNIGLPIWLLFSTQYVVTEADLKVISGPFKWDIPLSDIHSISPSKSALSAPALSLKRLKIEYGEGKSVLVSPKSHERFIEALNLNP